MSETRGHERSDANSRGLMWFLIGLALSAVVMHVVLVAFFFFLKRKDEASHHPGVSEQLVLARSSPPDPRLQKDPPKDLQLYLERERKHLNEYGWVDRGAGIGRIPIQRAMEIMSHEPAKH